MKLYQRCFNVVSTSDTDAVSTFCNVEKPSSDFVSLSTTLKQRWSMLKCWLDFLRYLGPFTMFTLFLSVFLMHFSSCFIHLDKHLRQKDFFVTSSKKTLWSFCGQRMVAQVRKKFVIRWEGKMTVSRLFFNVPYSEKNKNYILLKKSSGRKLSKLSNNTIILSRHEQACLIRLSFERYFSHHHGGSMSQNVA